MIHSLFEYVNSYITESLNQMLSHGICWIVLLLYTKYFDELVIAVGRKREYYVLRFTYECECVYEIFTPLVQDKTPVMELCGTSNISVLNKALRHEDVLGKWRYCTTYS
jgi:hypothetical protein